MSDVHGSDRCFRKFLNAGKFYDADVLILGGDVVGKMLIPIVRNSDGSFEVREEEGGKRLLIKSRTRLEEVKKEVSDAGGYPYVADQKEIDELRAEADMVARLFKKLAIERLQTWIRLADERLAGGGTKCYISPGNDDFLEVDQVLKSGTYVTDPEGRVVDIGGQHEMITLGYTNRTPWSTPREMDESTLRRRIDEMLSEVKRMETAIFNLHVPPIDTLIDQAPKLDEGLKPVVSGGSPVMISAGSTAVRKSIEDYQPLLGLHGHIHESRGMVRIGRTMCFNPGSEYAAGVLKGVLCELDGDSIKSYLLTSG